MSDRVSEVGSTPHRVASVWVPDWPVVAAGFGADDIAAVMFSNRVVARTAAAALEGVVIGQRRRQAQRRCPELELVDHDPLRDAREFEPIVRAVAEMSPRFDVIEAGWISLATRGPSKYFGGEAALAERLQAVVGEGPGAGVGIADGRFASGIAARLGARRSESIVVDVGGSTDFCSGLPIGWLQTLGESDAELIDLFSRLGLRRLGDLAALSASDVLGRFGHPGVHAHRLASGDDQRPPSTAHPAPERRLDTSLDDPAGQTSAVVFVAKQLADELGESLAAEGRVCTRLVVVLESEHGERSERSWFRSAGMTAQAMVERVRWQLDAWVNLPRGSDQELTGGVSLVRLIPDEVRADIGDQMGLWGGQSEADRQATRAIARLTSITSDDAVTVPVWHGGRLPADRYRWVPTSMVDLDRHAGGIHGSGGATGPGGPWPGTLPPPSPAAVFAEPHPVEVLDEGGALVEVTGRGVISAPPVSFRVLTGDEATGWRRGRARNIAAWAGPWPIDEKWWEPERHRRLARFQMVADDDRAYLIIAEHQRWWVGALYD